MMVGCCFVSRRQLADLLLADDLTREHLIDPDAAERLARTVAEFHQQRTQPVGPAQY
jgi:aminoglycoside phosphotransferase family enzyme